MIAGSMAMLLACFTVSAQQGYHVNAGPDIDVCVEGSVNLHAETEGGATVVVWSGGKGNIHPDRKSADIEYTPTVEETGHTIELIVTVSNPDLGGNPVSDTVLIHVNEQPEAFAGADTRICSNESVQLHGTVTRKFKSVLWKTNGSGTFNYDDRADAVYTPSKKDIEAGGFSLEFTAIPEGVCVPSTDAMVVLIDPAPEYTVSGLQVAFGREAYLAIKSDIDPGHIEWITYGSGKFNQTNKAEVVYRPSAEDMEKGSVSMQVTVGAMIGSCEVKKNVTLIIQDRPGK